MIRQIITLICLSLFLMPFAVYSGLWTEDYEKAMEEAKESGKFVLLDFTGSDWCAWCKRLDSQVFSRKEFKDFAKENLVCVKVDFPYAKKQFSRKIKQNRKLKAEYGVRGFPTIILLRPDGEKVGQTGYMDGGPEKYVEHLEKMLAPHRDKVVAKALPQKAGGIRTWRSAQGSTIEAKYYQRSGHSVVLQRADGSQIKIKHANLSTGDQEYLRSIRVF